MDDGIIDGHHETGAFQEFDACPVVELTGVVSAGGVGAYRAGTEDLWRLSLMCVAWRVGDGPIRTDHLTVKLQLPDEERERFQTRIEASSLVSISARLLEDDRSESPQALLEAVVDPDATDPALQEVLDEYREPDSFDDDRFGTFELDRGADVYETDADWMGEPVELMLEASAPEDCDQALDVATALWDEQSSWTERIDQFAVQELLALKNDAWREGDEAAVSAAAFTDRMELHTVSVEPNGAFAFWHDDDELFWGHTILICGSLSEGLTRADIPG